MNFNKIVNIVFYLIYILLSTFKELYSIISTPTSHHVQQVYDDRMRVTYVTHRKHLFDVNVSTCVLM